MSSWAPGPADHLLHGESGETRLGSQLRRTSKHRCGGGTHLIGGLQAQRDAADIRLVRDVRRQNLDRHRKADEFRRGCCRFRRSCDSSRYHRDAVGCQDALGFGFGKYLATGFEHTRDDLCGSMYIRRFALGQSGRRLEQLILVASIGNELEKSPHGFFRGRVVGNPRAVEDAACFGDRILAEPAAQYGFGQTAHDWGACVGDFCARDNRRRGMDEEDRIAVRLVAECTQRFDVALDGCVADDVERIASRPGSGQALVETGEGSGR